MNKRKFIFWAILSILLFFVTSSFAASPDKQGKGDEKSAKERAPALSPLGFDIFLLMDISGSMKRTDPKGYQKLASRLFVSLLKVEDRIGIITFGESAQVVLPLTPDPRKNQEEIWKGINRISPNAQFTNLYDAIRLGLVELEKTKRENRLLILLSDGQLDLGSREKEKDAMGQLSKLWPEFAKEKIKIYPIAFTDMSDLSFMEDVAQKTGGFFRFAKRDKDIPAIFGSIFEKMKSPDTIPLVDNTFTVDANIQEAIVMVTKETGTKTELTDPAQKKHRADNCGPNIQWYPTEIFDMVTIQNPMVGPWKITLSSKEGNRVFILTNLKLQSSFAKNFVNKGEKIPLEAFLEKNGEILKQKEFLNQVSFSAEVTPPDKQSKKINFTAEMKADDSQKKTGVFIAEFVADQTGEYSIKITAEGKTFKREKNFHFKAQEAQTSGQQSVKEEQKDKVPALQPAKEEQKDKPPAPQPAKEEQKDPTLPRQSPTEVNKAPVPPPPAEPKAKEDNAWMELLKTIGIIHLILLTAIGGVYLLAVGGGFDMVKKVYLKRKKKKEEKEEAKLLLDEKVEKKKEEKKPEKK